MKTRSPFHDFPGTAFRGLLCLALLAMLAGCGSQQPAAGLPPVPEERVQSVEVAVAFPPLGNLARNTVQVPYSNIAVRSTVVIRDGVTGAGKKAGAGLPVSESEALAVARDEMEKELIRRGFRIIDRQQVEAKLAELALDKPCPERRLWWRCTTRLNDNEVAYLDRLKAQADKGELSAEQYSREMERARTIWEKRTDNLKSLLEAVRAEQILADYVLELEAFEPAERVTQVLDLNDIVEVRRFLGDYPGLQGALGERRYLRCETVGARLKARLINTDNSEVVWLGGHTVSETDLGQSRYLLEVGVRRQVSNREQVLAFLEEHGAKAAERAPQWEFRNELVGPRLLQGSCGVAGEPAEMLQRTSNHLAGQVARELVATIKVEGGQVIRSAPSSPGNGGASSAGSTSDKNRFLRDSLGPLQMD